jgi:hypothetical protein
MQEKEPNTVLNRHEAAPNGEAGRTPGRPRERWIRVLALAIFASLLSFGLPQAQITGTKWKPIGPAPIGGFFKGGVSGRTTAIAVNPLNGDQIWLGTASGGVWYSPDGGATWYPMTDGMGALAIGAIAVTGCDFDRCTKVFAGTGENAIRRDTYYGRGLLVGTYITGSGPPNYAWFLRHGDATVDFNLGSINDVVYVANPMSGLGRVIVSLSSGVTASATESTVTAAESAVGGYGLYSSIDDGVTWTKLNVAGAAGARPTDLEVHPTNGNKLYAGFLELGVFKSEDAGVTWCPLSAGITVPPGCTPASGLPDGGVTAFDFVEMAIFRPDPSILYASFGHCTDPLLKKCVPSLYKTTNSGLTWMPQYVGTAFPTGGAHTEPQGYSRYTHALVIHPSNDNVVYMGGIRLWKTNNGGASFFTFDQNNAPGSSIFGDILHADHHEIVWDPSTTGRIYNANDGGFAYTTGTGWYPANEGLQITGFQSMSASTLTDRVIGGTQDNSAAMWTGSKTWTHLPCCGDAGSTVMDAKEPLTMYALSEYGDVRRSLNGGASWCEANAGLPNKEFEPRAFYAPMEQDPSSPHPLYWGGQKLYTAQPQPGRDSCSNVTWSAVSPALQTGSQPEIYGGEDVITAIGISESNSGCTGQTLLATTSHAGPTSGPGCPTPPSRASPCMRRSRTRCWSPSPVSPREPMCGRPPTAVPTGSLQPQVCRPEFRPTPSTSSRVRPPSCGWAWTAIPPPAASTEAPTRAPAGRPGVWSCPTCRSTTSPWIRPATVPLPEPTVVGLSCSPTILSSSSSSSRKFPR